MQEQYGKTQEELKRLCLALPDIVNEDGEVTAEEWNNWIKSSEDAKRNVDKTEDFFQTHSEFSAWQNLFFKLSKGRMTIDLDNLKSYIRDSTDIGV